MRGSPPCCSVPLVLICCGPESGAGVSGGRGRAWQVSGYSVVLALWLQFNVAGLGSFGSLPLLLLFMVGMYFFLVRPNQQKQKQWQEMLGQLKSGDQVTTNGGLRGTVISLKDDKVILRVQPDGIKLEFVKSAIAAVTPAGE